jgi:hypothetical protein
MVSLLRNIYPPFVPAKAGTQSQELDPRFRGDERSLWSASE